MSMRGAECDVAPLPSRKMRAFEPYPDRDQQIARVVWCERRITDQRHAGRVDRPQHQAAHRMEQVARAGARRVQCIRRIGRGSRFHGHVFASGISTSERQAVMACDIFRHHQTNGLRDRRHVPVHCKLAMGWTTSRAGLRPRIVLQVAVSQVGESSRRMASVGRVKRRRPTGCRMCICSPAAHHNGAHPTPRIAASPVCRETARVGGTHPAPRHDAEERPGRDPIGNCGSSTCARHPFAPTATRPYLRAPPEIDWGTTPQVDCILHGRCPPTFSGSQNGIRPTGRYP